MLKTSSSLVTGVRRLEQYSFDPDLNHKLSEWNKLAEKGFILVHAVRASEFKQGQLYTMRAEEAFRKWDVFSCSLIRRERIPSVERTGGGLRTRRPAELYSPVGLILEVPPENILGTFPHDVFFPTHETGDNYKFIRSINMGRTLQVSSDGKRARIKGGFRQIQTPDAIMAHTWSYNEILVVGKPGLGLHDTPSKEVKVKGIIYSPGASMLNTPEEMQYEQKSVIARLRALNPGLEFWKK